eukprot:GHVL01031181.1.p1 GENE.GHVL01031181.1~~GHVL01031181.1.p1  ORF type:complete len:439 (+),score=70.03 GHVL01031181.1:116-1432(+)
MGVISKKTSRVSAETKASLKRAPSQGCDQIKEASLLDRVQCSLHDSHLLQVSSVRAKEADQIEGFLHRCIESNKSGSMYISGCPGSGKTSLLRSIVDDNLPLWQKKNKTSCQVIKLNAMACKDGKSLFLSLVEALGCKMPLDSTIAQMADQIHNLTSSSKPPKAGKSQSKKKQTIVIIDEVDQIFVSPEAASRLLVRRSSRTNKERQDLNKMANDPLMQLFGLPSRPSSNLVLIGIANSADLFERMMPLLKLTNSHPESVVFEPYCVDQLREIIIGRLKSATNDGSLPLFNERAIELLVKKMASFHGDCRQALDACRRALVAKSSNIRSAEEDNISKRMCFDSKKAAVCSALSEASTVASSRAASLSDFDDEPLPQVNIADVANVLSSVMQQDNNVAAEFLANMPLQQKFVLYAACKVADKAKTECLSGADIMVRYII